MPMHIYYGGHLGEEGRLEFRGRQYKFRKGEIREVPLRREPSDSGFLLALEPKEVAERYRLTEDAIRYLVAASTQDGKPLTVALADKRPMVVMDGRTKRVLSVLATDLKGALDHLAEPASPAKSAAAATSEPASPAKPASNKKETGGGPK